MLSGYSFSQIESCTTSSGKIRSRPEWPRGLSLKVLGRGYKWPRLGCMPNCWGGSGKGAGSGMLLQSVPHSLSGCSFSTWKSHFITFSNSLKHSLERGWSPVSLDATIRTWLTLQTCPSWYKTSCRAWSLHLNLLSMIFCRKRRLCSLPG